MVPLGHRHRMEPHDHLIHIEHALSLSLEIQTLKVENNLFAFHRQVQLRTGGQPSLFLEHTSLLPINPHDHGFVNADNLAKLLAHQPFEKKSLVVLSPDELVAYRHSHDFTEVLPGNTELSTRNPVSCLQQEGWGPDNVIRTPKDTGFLFDRHRRLLPTCLMLDFIETNVSDQSHDVDAVVRLLLAHPDIRVIHQSLTSLEVLATTVEEAIDKDPLDPSARPDICFFWHPSDEQFHQTWERAQQLQSYKPIHAMGQAFMDLDFGGLSAARR